MSLLKHTKKDLKTSNRSDLRYYLLSFGLIFAGIGVGLIGVLAGGVLGTVLVLIGILVAAVGGLSSGYL